MDPGIGDQVSPAAKKQKTENLQKDGQIYLQVGECQFMTTLETLKGSQTLEEMFKPGGTRPAKTEDGFYFIDRDGEMFQFVLRYLRKKSVTFRNDFRESDLLLREAVYYQIRGMIDALSKNDAGKLEIFELTVMTPKESDEKIHNDKVLPLIRMLSPVHMFLQKERSDPAGPQKWNDLFRDFVDEMNFTMLPYQPKDFSPGTEYLRDTFCDDPCLVRQHIPLFKELITANRA